MIDLVEKLIFAIIGASFVAWVAISVTRCTTAYADCAGGVVVKDYLGFPTCVKPVLK